MFVYASLTYCLSLINRQSWCRICAGARQNTQTMYTTYLTPPLARTVWHCQEWTSQPLLQLCTAYCTPKTQEFVPAKMLQTATSIPENENVNASLKHCCAFIHGIINCLTPENILSLRKDLVLTVPAQAHAINYESYDLNVSKCRLCLQTVGCSMR